MTPTPDPAAPAVEVVDRSEALRLADLTDGVWKRLKDGERFTMRVPAEPDRDMDLILCRAAAMLRRLAASPPASGRTP